MKQKTAHTDQRKATLLKNRKAAESRERKRKIINDKKYDTFWKYGLNPFF